MKNNKSKRERKLKKKEISIIELPIKQFYFFLKASQSVRIVPPIIHHGGATKLIMESKRGIERGGKTAR